MRWQRMVVHKVRLLPLLTTLLLCCWNVFMVDGNESVSGGFGELEISPTLITRVMFKDAHLPIWGHRKNAQRDAHNRQYFTLPLTRLLPNTASCIHSKLTGVIILHFKVEMWSQEAESAILDELKTVTRASKIRSGQLSIIPMERIRFVWKTNLISLDDQFLLDDAWQSYALKTNRVTVSIHAGSLKSCNSLRDNIMVQPAVLGNLELQFILQAKKSLQKKVRVKGEHLARSTLIRKATPKVGPDGTVLLNQGDINEIGKEVSSTITAERETDAGYVDKEDTVSLAKLLSDTMKERPVKSPDITPEQWASVYWNPKQLRPDLLTKTLNGVFTVSDENADVIRVNADRYKEMTEKLPMLSCFGSCQASGTLYSVNRSEIKRWLKKNNLGSEWTGARFVIKECTLYRLDINKLLNTREIVSTDVQVHSSERIYNLKPVIPEDEPRNTTATEQPSVVRMKITELEKQATKLEDTIDQRFHTVSLQEKHLENRVNALQADLSSPLRKLRISDQIAMGACATMSKGHTYAVRRVCHSSLDCNAWCKREKFSKSQHYLQITPSPGCAGSLHIYKANHEILWNSTALINGDVGSYQVYNYKTCSLAACGPNYCCCTSN